MAIDDNTSYELTGYQVKDLAGRIRQKADSASLAPVATSGLYSDITGAPTVPTVYNGALTIQQNGTTLGTFTANSSDDKTVNIQAITAGEVGVITSSMIDWLSVMDKIYPVGSIYMSATMSTVEQVQTALGGTWVKWGAGRVPVGVDPNDTSFDTVEETGGEKNHTLIVDEIPSHYHNLGQMYDGYHLTTQTAQPRGVYADHAQAVHTTSIGGGQAHNNLQPYITCYMYKRTA